MKYYIGVEGGGSYTTVRAKDDKNTKIFNYKITGSNLYSADINLLKEQLLDLAIKINYNHNLKNCVGIYFGIAGGVTEQEQNLFLDPFISQGFDGKYYFAGDSDLGLYTNELDGQGILMIAGTGSICKAVKGDQELVIGGWGHLFGDEGSAYWISRQAISRAFKEVDKREINSDLMDIVLNHFGVLNPQDLVSYLYNPKRTKSEIASLAKYLYEVKDKNKEILVLFSKAAKDCLVQISLAIETLKYYNGSIVLNGSVIVKNTFIRDKIIQGISSKYPNTKLFFLEDGAVDGAVELCKKMSNKEI